MYQVIPSKVTSTVRPAMANISPSAVFFPLNRAKAITHETNRNSARLRTIPVFFFESSLVRYRVSIVDSFGRVCFIGLV